MAQVKVSESIPDTPSLRTVDLYIPYNGWLYVYKYTGSDANRNVNVCAQALSMVVNASLYYYENPGWGQYGWSCVTYISYCINVAMGATWIFGSSYNNYFWSPRYGGAYDSFLINNGYTKYSWSDYINGVINLDAGDIIQSNDHAVLVTTGDDGETPTPGPDPGPGPGPSPYPGGIGISWIYYLNPFL